MGDLVSFGVQKLWELLSQEYEQFRGVGDQITELKTDLLTLKSFLKDADAKKHTSAMVKTYVEQIKEIIYDAEDIIETLFLKGRLGKRSGIKNCIKRVACVIPEHRKTVLEIEGISKKIAKVIGDMRSIGVQQIVASDGSIGQPLHNRQSEMRHTFSRDYESDLVGMEENITKVVEWLLEEEKFQVVSITGMGGVGKTTLARQVFNSEKVKHHFNGLVWVCISQEFTRKCVWQTILRNLRPKEDGKSISQMWEPELQGELYQLLGTSKSLIVLDDIWNEEDWDLIKKILPPEKGSKVLLTSRKKSIVERSDTRVERSDTRYVNFHSKCLSKEDSWTLLQRIVFPKTDASELKVDKEMENLGKQMVKHCGGLPLAVKVLGGLLAANYTVHAWKRIFEGIGSRILEGSNSKDNNNNSVGHVLSLSFEELPNYLKHCFLYLAHFPEDRTISVKKLSYYWAAEDILNPRYYNEESIRDVGDRYMEELVQRNMVISERNMWTSRFETCHLHDMMREICLSKAKEENFLQVVGVYSSTADSQSPSPSRRLIVSRNPSTLQVERDLNNPKLRSLLIVMDYTMDGPWILSCSFISRFQLLRVLDLSRAEFEEGKLPSSIGKLIHLRYLSLHVANVSHLPSSLRNLKLLIYLNIEVYIRDIYVPDFLMEMQELRYLALPWHMHEKTKLELSSLVNLETLQNFSTRNSSLEYLHGMTRLRNLSISVNDETSIQTISASIGGLRHLEYLSLENHGYRQMTEEGFVLDSIHLKHLSLSMRIPRLSDVQQLPSNLTNIVLHGCQLEEDPMPILEKLPHLEVVYLWFKSFCGRRMVCSGSGFPQLRKLDFDKLYDLEEWIVEEGSMPLLHTLVIHHCGKLKELPDGFRFIDSLQNLSIDKEWEERLSKGREDYYKIQHIPSVKYGWR